MWVKICGNTYLDDALAAVACGTDALGFVFAPSVRRVTAEEVAAITRRLPPGVERIGVFPAWGVNEIVTAVRQGGLTGVQLHGGVNPALAGEVQQEFQGEVHIIQVLHWVVGAEGQRERLEDQLGAAEQDPAIGRILVDSQVGAASGGTGRTFDWESAGELFRGRQKPVIAAGGLTPENVAEAILRLAPWGVDVASGVELAPGRKDTEKMRRFVAEARAGGR